MSVEFLVGWGAGWIAARYLGPRLDYWADVLVARYRRGRSR